jgi:tetratricopeptide (TPR) repeat protein
MMSFESRSSDPADSRRLTGDVEAPDMVAARARNGFANGRYVTALAAYDRGIAMLATDRRDRVHDLAVWIAERGQVLMALGHSDLAIRDFDRAISHVPDLLAAHANKATVLQTKGRLEDAMAVHDKVVAIAPERADVHYNRGNALAQLERVEEAVSAYQRAIELDSNFHHALTRLVQLLWERRQPERAIAFADRACKATPNSAEVHTARGLIRQIMGQRDGARADYETALRILPSHADALSNYVHLERIREPDDWRIQRLESLVNRRQRPLSDRAVLHFALGKAYDDVGAVPAAFSHFDTGARFVRSQIDYDEDRENRVLSRLIGAFTREQIDRYEADGLSTEQPVFVIGMPRSGTTLTEQILASHPQIYGAGELELTTRAVRDVTVGARPGPRESGSRKYNLDVMPQRARDYLDGARALAPDPDVARIVDKMPGNAWRVGFIHLMFPNARIIHCARDPLDTCLSCFQKLFATGHHWSYDLQELGRHYRRYHRVMQHWEKILPGRTLTVRYEDTVADLEGQARRIVDHVGLEWDPACLDYYRTERAVMTASHSQVRQPIYASSVRRWEAYRPYLQPLVDALGPLAEHARRPEDSAA